MPPLEQTDGVADYSDYSDVVLYDVFFETGTQLGGTLVALEREAAQVGNTAAAERWAGERRRMRAERSAVNGRDRAAQVAAIGRWAARRRELDELLDAGTV